MYIQKNPQWYKYDNDVFFFLMFCLDVASAPCLCFVLWAGTMFVYTVLAKCVVVCPGQYAVIVCHHGSPLLQSQYSPAPRSNLWRASMFECLSDIWDWRMRNEVLRVIPPPPLRQPVCFMKNKKTQELYYFALLLLLLFHTSRPIKTFAMKVLCKKNLQCDFLCVL